MRNKIRQHSKLLFGIVFLSLISVLFIAQPTFATTITKDKTKKVASFPAVRYGIQGGTITEKYYVFADKDSGQNGLTNIRFFDRNTKKEVKPDSSLTGASFMHASNVHYEWGTGYAQVADAGSGNWWCFSVNTKKVVSDSNCGSMLRSGSLDHGSVQHYRQGWTKYDNHYFRAYGDGLSLGNNVEVYDGNGKFIESMPVSSDAMPACEIEDVAVDGNEGILYVLCDGKSNGHAAEYYKIDKSLFSKYITAKGGSADSKYNADDLYGSETYDPEKDDLTIRDETYQPEIAQSTYDGTVDTVNFGTVKDTEGCGVYTTISFIIDILSIGIGIAGVIGIAIAGSIYLSSKGNTEKTTKAKRRIYEIVIGLVAYGVVYALLTFLTPEFNPELKVCKALTAEEKAAIQAETEAKREAADQAKKEADEARTKKGTYDTKPKEDKDEAEISVAEKRKNMLKAARETATIFGNKQFVYSDYPAVSWKEVNRGKYTTNCAAYVILAAIKAGLMPDRNNTNYVELWFNYYGRKAHIGKKTKEDLQKHFQLIKGNSTISKLTKSGRLAPGDIIGSGEYWAHTAIYAGKKGNNCVLYEVTNRGRQYKNKILNNEHSCSYKVGYIIHIK